MILLDRLFLVVVLLLALSCYPAEGRTIGYRGDPVYGYDRRCAGSARYQTMSDGADCNACPRARKRAAK